MSGDNPEQLRKMNANALWILHPACHAIAISMPAKRDHEQSARRQRQKRHNHRRRFSHESLDEQANEHRRYERPRDAHARSLRPVRSNTASPSQCAQTHSRATKQNSERNSTHAFEESAGQQKGIAQSTCDSESQNHRTRLHGSVWSQRGDNKRRHQRARDDAEMNKRKRHARRIDGIVQDRRKEGAIDPRPIQAETDHDGRILHVEQRCLTDTLHSLPYRLKRTAYHSQYSKPRSPLPGATPALEKGRRKVCACAHLPGRQTRYTLVAAERPAT